MEDSAEPVGHVHVLGRSQIWPAIAIPGAAAIVLIVVAVGLRFIAWSVVILVGAALVIAITRRRNAVLVDDVGLLIQARGGLRRSYAWSEIDRMGWEDSGPFGSTLVVFPRGSPYDVPGPNSPVGVGRIWRLRRRHVTPDPLPDLLRRHGIKSLLDR